MSQSSGHNFLEAPVLLQELDYYTSMQEASERQETAAAVKLRHDLSAALAVPEDCLTSSVPVILKAVDDHVLFPFSPFWSEKRWVRVGSFDTLAKICPKFKAVLLDTVLVIHVMPYLSPTDSFKIHQMIGNPGRIELLREAPVEARILPVSSRSGLLVVPDPRYPNDDAAALHLKFTVLNYGLLWAKASEFSILIGTLGPARQLNSLLEHQINNLLEDPEAVKAIQGEDHLADLEESCEQAKRELFLSLHYAGFNPHDTILAIDAELHEAIYDLGYDPCYPYDRTKNQMRAFTETALEEYMVQLRNENPDHNIHSVRKARQNVLVAESSYAVEACRVESTKQFYDAIKACKEQLADAVNKMNAATSKPSLIGVIGRDARAM